jgi:phosphoglucomutase
MTVTREPGDRARLRFGTSGWRGVLGEEFTFAAVRALLDGIAGWLAAEAAGGEVLVARDTRFLGERLAATAAASLASRGLRPRLARGATPTPAVARALRRGRAYAALVFTASHNPPEYQGLKVLDRRGAGIDDRQAREIEARARAARGGSARSARPGGTARAVDLNGPYVRDLVAQLDRRALAGAGLCVVYDAMHGAGAGVFDAALERAGLRVRLLRGAPDPRFGGEPPDPAPERLRALAREVRALRGRRIGVATDGDADRFAAMDADGRLLDASEGLALLVDHLARTGRLRRGVALSIATGSLVERVALDHGLAVTRHRIGFKHLARALESGSADAAGEESGGFALAGFGRDKDGMLAGALLAELAAQRGASLRGRLAELRARHGPAVCGRVALARCDRVRGRLARLCQEPPERVAGGRVRSVSRLDGLHLGLDDGFLMLRASGTEPVVRVYAEAASRRALARRLLAGRRLLGAGD